LWYLQDRLAVRDAVLWQYQASVDAAYNLLGILAGLNRLYYSSFQFKRMRSFIAKMTVAPANLAERLESLFQPVRRAAADELERLVSDTLSLVSQHMPEVDTTRPRRYLGRRLEAWQPPTS
jgi:hypothetical protein